LKHASDLFDQRRAELRKQFKTQGMAEEDIEINQRPEHYSGKYFYVPPRARWNQGWQETVMEDGVKKTVQRPALKHTKERCRHYPEQGSGGDR
jgi:type I restriction enzyme M protein